MFTASASASVDQQTKRKSKESSVKASDHYYDDYIRQKAKGISKFCPAVRCRQILIKHD